MTYLLIDFGATYIKCAVYNKDTQDFEKEFTHPSPFTLYDRVSKEVLFNILSQIVVKSGDVDGVVICTILGGGYIDNIYHSWKSPDNSLKACDHSHCMISGLFDSAVHHHHKPFTTNNNYVTGLDVIGQINGVPVYNSLGDTDCVIESLTLDEHTKAINIGTGSQVISQTAIERYFPAGRAFLVYQELFNSLGLDIFDLMKTLTVDDVIKSNLEVDLAVFPQARSFRNGGSISNIVEGSFTIKNLLGSILKEFVLQYQHCISDVSTVLLVGGVAKKIAILPELFQIYNPGKEIVLVEDGIESTHKGMIKYINKHL